MPKKLQKFVAAHSYAADGSRIAGRKYRAGRLQAEDVKTGGWGSPLRRRNFAVGLTGKSARPLNRTLKETHPAATSGTEPICDGPSSDDSCSAGSPDDAGKEFTEDPTSSSLPAESKWRLVNLQGYTHEDRMRNRMLSLRNRAQKPDDAVQPGRVRFQCVHEETGQLLWEEVDVLEFAKFAVQEKRAGNAALVARIQATAQGSHRLRIPVWERTETEKRQDAWRAKRMLAAQREKKRLQERAQAKEFIRHVKWVQKMDAHKNQTA
jgi:hypothetical protein